MKQFNLVCLKTSISKHLNRNLATLNKKGRSNNKVATLTTLVMPFINRGERDETTRWATFWFVISEIIVFKAMLTMSRRCSFPFNNLLHNVFAISTTLSSLTFFTNGTRLQE
jgi:hypothetical protein